MFGDVVVVRRKIRTVRRMIKHLPSKMIQDLSSAIDRVRAGVVMKKQNLGTEISPALVLNRSSFSMFHNISEFIVEPCSRKKTVAMIFLADKVCKHFLGLLGELVCPHSIDFFGVTSHVLPKSRPQLRHDQELGHHLSRRPREMSTMLPCAAFCGLLTRVSVLIWHKIYGSLAFLSQSHATNFMKFEETQMRTP